MRFSSLTFKAPQRFLNEKGLKVGHSGKSDKKCKEKADHGEIEYVDGDMARAMAHPLRVQILGVLNKRVMSASGFAKTYGEKLQNTSYHFRILKERGLIEEVGSRQVRGSTEHFYAAVNARRDVTQRREPHSFSSPFGSSRAGDSKRNTPKVPSIPPSGSPASANRTLEPL